MNNNIYKDWSKNDLIDEINKLKKRKRKSCTKMSKRISNN